MFNLVVHNLYNYKNAINEISVIIEDFFQKNSEIRVALLLYFQAEEPGPPPVNDTETDDSPTIFELFDHLGESSFSKF